MLERVDAGVHCSTGCAHALHNTYLNQQPCSKRLLALSKPVRQVPACLSHCALLHTGCVSALRNTYLNEQPSSKRLLGPNKPEGPKPDCLACGTATLTLLANVHKLTLATLVSSVRTCTRLHSGHANAHALRPAGTCMQNECSSQLSLSHSSVLLI